MYSLIDIREIINSDLPDVPAVTYRASSGSFHLRLAAESRRPDKPWYRRDLRSCSMLNSDNCVGICQVLFRHEADGVLQIQNSIVSIGSHLLRSPFTTALLILVIPCTWLARLALSVSSFQVLLAPLTIDSAPSFPSAPIS